jgi:hypothetical protein
VHVEHCISLCMMYELLTMMTHDVVNDNTSLRETQRQREYEAITRISVL